MEISYPEIALIMGGVIALFKLVEKGGSALYNLFVKQTDKGGLDNKQSIDIAVIKNQLHNYEINHFPTIERRFDAIESKIDKIYEIVLKK